VDTCDRDILDPTVVGDDSDRLVETQEKATSDGEVAKRPGALAAEFDS